MHVPHHNWWVAFTVNDEYKHMVGNSQPIGRACWTWKGAQRLARRWNLSNHGSFGVFEVYGPRGKGEDE